MKKISLLTLIIFHIANVTLIILYLYPGSILGWLTYGDFQKQPQITSDLSFFFLKSCLRIFDIIYSWIVFTLYEKYKKFIYIFIFYFNIFRAMSWHNSTKKF